MKSTPAEDAKTYMSSRQIPQLFEVRIKGWHAASAMRNANVKLNVNQTENEYNYKTRTEYDCDNYS